MSEVITRRNPRVIETKFPITWVITSAVSVVLTMGTVYMKVDATASQVAEMKITLAKMDDRQTQLMQAVMAQQSKNDLQQEQISRNYADISEIAKKVDQFRRGIQ